VLSPTPLFCLRLVHLGCRPTARRPVWPQQSFHAPTTQAKNSMQTNPPRAPRLQFFWEDEGRRTEDGGRRTEDGGRRTEDGGRRTEDEHARQPWQQQQQRSAAVASALAQGPDAHSLKDARFYRQAVSWATWSMLEHCVKPSSLFSLGTASGELCCAVCCRLRQRGGRGRASTRGTAPCWRARRARAAPRLASASSSSARGAAPCFGKLVERARRHSGWLALRSLRAAGHNQGAAANHEDALSAAALPLLCLYHHDLHDKGV
jgi:hypothetical protein